MIMLESSGYNGLGIHEIVFPDGQVAHPVDRNSAEVLNVLKGHSLINQLPLTQLFPIDRLATNRAGVRAIMQTASAAAAKARWSITYELDKSKDPKDPNNIGVFMEPEVGENGFSPFVHVVKEDDELILPNGKEVKVATAVSAPGFYVPFNRLISLLNLRFSNQRADELTSITVLDIISAHDQIVPKRQRVKPLVVVGDDSKRYFVPKAGSTRAIDLLRKERVRVEESLLPMPEGVEVKTEHFAELYGTLAEMVRRRAFYKVGLHPEIGDDIAAEVFASVFNAFLKGNYENREGIPITGWISTILDNEVRDYYRSSAFRKEISLQYVFTNEDGNERDIPSFYYTDDPLDVFIRLETARYLAGLIAENLTYAEARLLWMHFSGFSYEEIKDSGSGKSVGALRVKVHRALGKIRDKAGDLDLGV